MLSLLPLAASLYVSAREWGIRLYFVFQRRWRAVAAGAVSIIVLTLWTAAVLGIESYRAYIVEVMPTLGNWRSSWPNVSLPGFWSKLFDPTSDVGTTIPLVRSPLLARACTGISCALVIAAVVVVVRRARSRYERDHAFATCIRAMLLVTAVVWDHYLLLLLLPVALLWTSLPTSGPVRWDFRLIPSLGSSWELVPAWASGRYLPTESLISRKRQRKCTVNRSTVNRHIH